jgi:hypothetical protein
VGLLTCTLVWCEVFGDSATRLDIAVKFRYFLVQMPDVYHKYCLPFSRVVPMPHKLDWPFLCVAEPEEAWDLMFEKWQHQPDVTESRRGLFALAYSRNPDRLQVRLFTLALC